MLSFPLSYIKQTTGLYPLDFVATIAFAKKDSDTSLPSTDNGDSASKVQEIVEYLKSKGAMSAMTNIKKEVDDAAAAEDAFAGNFGEKKTTKTSSNDQDEEDNGPIDLDSIPNPRLLFGEGIDEDDEQQKCDVSKLSLS